MSGEIFSRVTEVLARGEPGVSVTVVAAEGAPREPGARMLIFPDGRIEGTVGGSPLNTMQKALKLLRDGPQTLLEITSFGIGMPCGRKATLFYEVLQAPPTLAIFGAGHVGIFLAKIAREVTPQKIVLYDDRKESFDIFPFTGTCPSFPAERMRW